jgi:hypothetical protein
MIQIERQISDRLQAARIAMDEQNRASLDYDVYNIVAAIVQVGMSDFRIGAEMQETSFDVYSRLKSDA